MQYLSIDFLILYALLGITLFIGLRTGRGIKDIREYITGNKMFTTGALVLTWLATDVSGEFILSIVQYSRTKGIIQILSCAGWGLAYLMQGLIFAPKFLKFPNCMTIGDVMGAIYKGPTKVVTGILASLTAMCIMVMELTVLGLLSESLLGIDFYWGIAIGGSVLVLYTVHGGIKSVTYTDMFQFVVLAAIVPVIAVIALQHAGGIQEVLTHIPDAQARLVTHPNFYRSLTLFILLGFFQFDIIDPALIQRILMAKTKKQLRHQFLIASAVIFALIFTLILLGLTSIILFPDDAGIEYMLPHMIHQLLPVGLKGLAFAGLFAIVMSTFDSFLHAAGFTVVHDVVVPIYQNVNKGKTFNELKVTRLVTLGLGSIAIVIGLLRAEELCGFMDLSYLFTGPLLAFPLFAGVMGLKPDKYALYIASIVTILILAFTKWLLPEQQQRLATLISVCVNGTLFLGIHAIRNKGFAIVNYEKNAVEELKIRSEKVLEKTQ